jgi:hypothetical protein
MNIEQLQQLFSGLPESFIHEMKSKDFKTCWYGSSYLDKRPMELLDHSHPDALTDEKVDVFFYTDIDFFFLKNRIYTERFSGEILFFNSLICKFNLSFEDQKDYILNGNLICANLSLNNKKFIPNVTDGIIENKYKEKSELKLKFEEFWEIIEQLYPESLINEDYEFFQKNILLSDLNDLLCHLGLGIKKEEIKIVKDFIELKHQKSKKPELMDFDFSNYTFNAAIVVDSRC